MKDLLLGSILSAMATGMGALPILFFQNIAHKSRDFLLALTAGVMVSACTFSLIPTALEQGDILILTLGIILGVLLLTLLESTIPHVDLEHKNVKIESSSLLVLTAMTLHNIPEGISVGVSYAEQATDIGPLVAIAIGSQNFPEGFLVALFLIQQSISKMKAFLLASLTGVVEIFGALFGYMLSNTIEGLVPYGLSFAAGAMLFIVYKELIPESHGDGNATSSTMGFIGGLLLMLYIIEIFG